MVLQNNWNKSVTESGIDWYIFNGLMGHVTDIKDYDPTLETFKLSFKPIFFKEDKEFSNILMDAIYFKENIKSDDLLYDKTSDLYDVYQRTMFKRKVEYDTSKTTINKCHFGYALTSYKVQGMEFNNVMYMDEAVGGKEFTQAARYVGITRAKEKIIIGV